MPIVIEAGWDPILFRLGPLEIGWHGIFTALALLAGLRLATWLAPRRGATPEQVSALLVWVVIGGLVGARVFHVADHWPEFAANPARIVAIWEGGIAVYGAFVGGVIAGLLGAWRLGLPVWPLLDVAGPAMLLGQAVGRTGCFANGDATGAPCGSPPCLPIAVVYTHPNALVHAGLLGVPTHPYPLYEVAGCLLVLGALWAGHRWLAAPGRLFLASALGYSAVRFVLAVFRDENIVAFGLQQAQLVALLTAAAALIGYLWFRPVAPTPVEGS